MAKEIINIFKRNIIINIIWFLINLKKNTKYLLILSFYIQVFIISLLFGIFNIYGLIWHIFILSVFLFLFFLFLIKLLKNFKYYSKSNTLLWIDGKNYRSINPLTALQDYPASTNYNKELWYLHKENIKNNIKNVRLYIPRLVIDEYDPLKLRFLFTFIMILSAYWAYENNRFKYNLIGFTKFSQYIISNEYFHFKAWISPPNYTNTEKKLLEVAKSNKINNFKEIVPINSILNLYINTNHSKFSIKSNDNNIEVRKIDTGNYEATIFIDEKKNIIVNKKNINHLTLNLSVKKDELPKIQFLSTPNFVNNGSLSFVTRASDDYGVKEIIAYIKRPLKYEHFKEEHIAYKVFSNINSNEDNKSIESYFFEYVADSVWAGNKTLLELYVLDYAKQSNSIMKVIQIPSKKFNDELAREIISFRESLAKSKSFPKETLKEFKYIFEDHKYLLENENVNTAYLAALRALDLKEKFEFSVNSEAFKSLYVLAQVIEEGKSYFAKKNIEQIEQNLFDSIKQKETDKISTNARKLQDTIDSLLDLENKKNNDKNYNDEAKKSLKDQIEKLTKQIEDLLKTGSKKGINEKIQQLKQLSESIKNPNNNKESEAKLQKKKEFLNKLSELLNDQEKVMEETFNKAAERGKFKQSSEGSGGKTPKEKQEELRNTLGNVMRDIGASENEIPQELGRADRAMRQASRDLENGRPDEAANAQGRALEMIQKSINKMNSENYMTERPQTAEKGKENYKDTNKEYLAENENIEYQGTAAGGKIKIPNQREVKNVSKIANELYKRYNEENRSLNDKRHIKNLLDWY